jgi:hypothetical protein
MYWVKSGAIVLGCVLMGLLVLMMLAPGTRPGFVQTWVLSARGFGPAKSAEDALAKFKKAIELREYEIAALFCAGDYREWIVRGARDAQTLGRAVDSLRSAMNQHGVKSDRADLLLFRLDPFPSSFQIDKVRTTNEGTTALLNWSEEISRFSSRTLLEAVDNADASVQQALLPLRLVPMTGLRVGVVEDEDDNWKVVLPVEVVDGRHVRSPIQALQKNATNFSNALLRLRDDVRNNPDTKTNFERSLRMALVESR